MPTRGSERTTDSNHRIFGRGIIMVRNVDVEDESMIICKTSDDAALEPVDGQNPAPILPVHAHRRPMVRARFAELGAGMLLDRPV